MLTIERGAGMLRVTNAHARFGGGFPRVCKSETVQGATRIGATELRASDMEMCL